MADSFRRAGFHLKMNTQMRTLGAPKELGEIDIVAWRTDDRDLFVVECKRLKGAKNIREIGDQLNDFKGKNDDNLVKHVKRVRWVEDNLDEVKKRLDIGYDGRMSVRSYIVTNRIVPMEFYEIEEAESRSAIVNIGDLTDIIIDT